MTFSRDEEVLMMLYSPGSKSGLVKALRKMSADLDLDDPEDNQLYQLTQSVQAKLERMTAAEFRQDIIDDFLRSGGNMEDHRMLVVAEFSKQKPISEIAAVLPRIFVGGHGLKLSAGDVSAWYYPDGIHLSYGRNIQHSRAAQIISWKDAAQRIGQLLEEGRYASNTELAEALYHEQSVLADRLVLASRDAVDGYMPTIRSIKGVFPDQLDSVIELLRSPDSLETISKEFAYFYAGYKAGEPVSRFKIYTIDQIASGLIDLTLPRREYATEWTQVPQPAGFITEDEIDTLFVSGPPMSGGKQAGLFHSQLLLCKGLGSASSRRYYGFYYQPLHNGFQGQYRPKVYCRAG